MTSGASPWSKQQPLRLTPPLKMGTPPSRSIETILWRFEAGNRVHELIDTEGQCLHHAVVFTDC